MVAESVAPEVPAPVTSITLPTSPAANSEAAVDRAVDPAASVTLAASDCVLPRAL